MKFITLVLLLLLMACGPTPQPQNANQQNINAQQTPGPVAEIDNVLNVPSDFKPVYEVARVGDVSASGTIRKTIIIYVPTGLDRATLESNLKHAAKDLYQKEKPGAIMVWAYKKNDSLDTPYTAGMLTFAPYGDWSKATEKHPLSSYKAVVEIRDDYLKK